MRGTSVASRQFQELIFRNLRTAAFAVAVIFFIAAGTGWGSVTGSISGVVHDSSGALIPAAEVVALNTQTGVKWTVTTDAQGFYSFQALPVGDYEVDVSKSGFNGYRQTGLALTVNAALAVDVTLQVGLVSQQVTVTSTVVHVDTTSTQMGEVIGSSKITEVPLLTRGYTDLLALQPGVVPVSSGMAGGQGGEFTATGFGIAPVSGDLNAGNLSVNGMRESANGFLLNGATVQESGFSGTAIIPNLDSIAEFRILTNNFDAEYGAYAGGQINVLTKSGTDRFHGDAFEFVRNTDLETRNFYDTNRGAYQQNQFGGTVGGPILRNKLFFFADYQGNRKVLGQSTGQVLVPSDAEREGDFSALTDPNQMTGTVQGPAWAANLSSLLGYTVTQGENYYTDGCTSATCVFPDAQIPSAAWTTPSKNILQYIPRANSGPYFVSSGAASRLQDDKGSGRLDANTGIGMVAGYYYYDQYESSNLNPTAPLFGGGSTVSSDVVNVGLTKSFGSSAVNEARIAGTRRNIFNHPTGGEPHGLSFLASLGFPVGPGALGPWPVQPTWATVPSLGFNAFGVGSGGGVGGIIENTFEGLDNFSKVVGTHTIKIGGMARYNQQTQYNWGSNGAYTFNGAETGIDFADYLIGAPVGFQQGQGFPDYGRNHYLGLYAQDSWRARHNLTLNYGLRWEFDTPWTEKHNEFQTLVPGLQSQVFPGSPTGWVFPGDPGIPRGLGPVRYNNFSPRVGIAYSPSADSGFLGKLIGGPGKTSIRAGFGRFFTTFEGATNFNAIGDAPFGYYYGSPQPPEFATPYVDRGTGFVEGQKFPSAPPPANSSPQHPDNNINWAQDTPISSSPGFFYKNDLPYAEDYEFSVERQLNPTTLLSLAYVGTQGHKLLTALNANPADQALCYSLSQDAGSQAAIALNIPGVMPGTQRCGPNGENGPFTAADGTVIPTTRLTFGPLIQSNAWFATLGNSSYNSFQASVRHTTGRLEFLAGYTFSKALSNASGYGEAVNPLDHNQRSLSAFDITNNFVTSYNYQLPFDKLGGPRRLTQGWRLSGITRFSTGIPVTLLATDDRSLLGTNGSGPSQLPIDTPNFSGGKLTFHDPRTQQAYFDTSMFSKENLGVLGSASRRFFHGPGINNWDVVLAKDTRLSEGTTLEIRGEFFNAFNHAQFILNYADYADPANFGYVRSANPGRIIQLGAKLVF